MKLSYDSHARFYHTMEHVQDLMIKRYQWMATEGLSPCESTLFAIILHDYVYEAVRSDNEFRSAYWAGIWMTRLGLSTSLISQVNDMIMSTEKHVPIRDDFETRMFLDLDLSILGSSPKVYDRYASNIRLEYAFVPSVDYYKRRNEILTRFLEKPSIYMTDYAREQWECQARVNLQNEIKSNSTKVK